MSANIVRFSGDYKIQAGFGTNQQANIYLGTKNNGTVYVDGNLLVSGTTTQITTTNTTIKDNIITLNAGESGSAVSLTLAGIEIDRGTNSNGKAQFLFDESIQWAHPNGTTRYGIFKFETATGGINGIRTNSIDTNGGNLNLINYSTGVIKVTGTNNYEEQVVEYDNNHDIVMPINPIDDDIIPNIKTIIDYVSNISAVGNVGITQNGGTLNIGLNKTVTISNTLTFAGTDSSTITLGTGGTVVYTRNKLSVFAATTSAELAGVISDETGSGALVFANTPTLITPTLGAALATSINGLTITSSTGTLTVANSKTLTASNTLTFTGTDSSSVAFGTGGTVTYTSNKLSVFSSTSSSELAGVISDETGSGALVFANTPTLVTPVLGVATATTINKVTISSVATGATLSIADNKIFTVNNTLTFSGTDSSNVAFGVGGTVAYKGTGLSQFANTTSSELAGIISDETGTGLLVFNNSPTIAGHPTIEGVTSTGATGTGNLVFSASPSLTGTVTIATLNLTNALGIAYGGTNSTSFTTPASNINPILYYNGTSLTNNSLAADIGYNSSTDNFFTRNITTVSLSSQSTSGGSLIQIQADPGAAMISGNRLGGIFFGGSTNNTHTIQNRVGIETFATQNWTVSNQGAKILFATTPNNTNSRVTALTLDQDQSATFAGHLTVEGVTSTGATGTGKFVFDNAPTISGHPTVEGVTSTGATGTGKFVFDNAPTISGHPTVEGVTSTGATGTGKFVFDNAPTISGHPTIEGVTSTGATGTGKFVFNGSPTLVTPTLGVATATSINSLTISTSTGTLTIADGKTLTASNTLTFTGTDTSNVEFGAGGTVTYTRNKLSVFSSTTSSELAGVISDETGTGLLVFGTSPTLSTSILTDSTTFGLINSTATTVNFAGAATTINIGASTGTITLGNQILTGTNLATFNMNGTSPLTIATSRTSSTANIFDSNVLTGNLFGAATTIAIGASSGTLTIGNATITGTNATAFNMNGASPSIVTSSTGTASVFNTNALTGNLFGAATTIAIGASSGTLTIGNATITGTNATAFNMNGTNPSIVTSDTGSASVFNTNALTGNLFGAATTITIGATTGTLNLRNVTITAANATTFNMNGTNPSIVTSNTGTANVFNTNALTGNLFGAATTITIGAINSTITLRNQTLTGSYLSTFNMNGASPLTIATSTASSTASLFIQNVITGNLFGSAETINIGSTVGTVYINNPTVVGSQITQNLYNTTATTMNFAGAATTTNISDSGNINLGSSTSATTTVKVGGSISGNTLKIASTTSGTITVSSDVTTGTINLFTDTTTGTINVGSDDDGIVDIGFTTESTSTTTGAVVVAGGVGIAKNLYVGEATTMMFQTTDPVADAGGVTVYTKNSDLNNTGIYYVNSNVSGELVSKKKALAYSIVFG